MTLTFDRTDEEEARVREWRLRATGFLPGGGKRPRPMPARDVGEIISQRQSRSRWQRGTGLEIRTAAGDTEAWLVHLAYALKWANAALASIGDPGQEPRWDADWAGQEQRDLYLALIVAGAAGQVSLSADLVPQDIDPDLRRELLGPDVEDLVLGYVDRPTGEWVFGYAGLREVDAEAFRLSLGQRNAECRRPDREHRGGTRCLFEVRDLIDRRQKRRRGMPLAIETVENRISAARTQLRTWAAEVGA